MKKIPNHEQLLIFSAVAECGSLIAASRRLAIPASSLGRKLADLEGLLGTKLIHRTTRSTHISSEGRYYLKQFAPLIREIERAQRFLGEADREPEGKLKIAAPFSFGIQKLEPIITEYLRVYPKVSIQLSLKNEYQDIVAEGLDLAISLGPLKPSSLIAKKLGGIVYRCVASPDYLGKNPSLRDPESLTGHTCIALARDLQPVSWSLNNPAGDREIKIMPAFAVNDPVYALAMCKKGGGISYLPDFLVAKDIRAGALQDVLPGWKARSRDLFAVYHHRHLMPISLKSLLQMLIENLGDHPTVSASTEV